MTIDDLFGDNMSLDPIGIWVKGSDEKYIGGFDCCRIPDDKVPEGYFRYSIREDDIEGEPATIEKYVGVNHFGDVILPKELSFGDKDYLELDGLDWGSLEAITANK